MKSFSNILIVRTDRIGDVILTTPAIKALRRSFPTARISILVAKATEDIVRGNPDIDEVIVDDRLKEHQGPFGFLKLAGELRSKNFDLAVIFHTKKRTNALCFLAGIPQRIGYKNNKWGFLLTAPIPDTRPQGIKHEAEYCLDLLKTIGVESVDLKLSVPVSREDEAWAEGFLRKANITPEDKVVVIHPAASDIDRCWPEEYFVQLTNQLVEKYSHKIIFIGSAAIKEVSTKIAGAVKFPVINLVGSTTLRQLAGLFKKSHLLISPDSGPMHMASALGLPVICIFLRNYPGINPTRWRPLGRHTIVLNKDVTPEIVKNNRYYMDPKRRYAITPGEVTEAVDAIFKLC